MSYLRVVIHATVELRSAMHVGCGEEGSVADRWLAVLNHGRAPPFADFAACQEDLKIAEVPEGRYQRTYRANKQAAIPASSFRALWRRALGAHESLTTRYFGPSTEKRQHLRAGWLRIADLQRLPESPSLSANGHPLPDHQAGTAVTQGIRMDPITGTVSEHLLWSYEYAPAGSRFELIAEIVPPPGASVEKSDLEALVKGLRQVGQSPARAIGHGTGKGMGLASVTVKEVRGIDAAAFATWLQSGTGRLAASAGDTLSFADKEASAPVVSVATLDLYFPFGLLAGEPFLARPKEKKGDKKDRRGEAHNAQHQYARDAEGLPMVRGSSLRGLLRAHATRILTSMLLVQGCTETEARDRARKSVDVLFGDTGHKGALAVSDARCQDKAHTARWRSFVAVDRFTGGAAENKLYDAHAADACSLRCQITALRELSDWERGLLLHVLRDAFDGDLALGWGKSKGLGGFRVALAHIGPASMCSTEELRAHVQACDARKADLTAFDEHVELLALSTVSAD